MISSKSGFNISGPSISHLCSNQKLAQLAMRPLGPGHFVAHESFLHTWGQSQNVAKCGPWGDVQIYVQL